MNQETPELPATGAEGRGRAAALERAAALQKAFAPTSLVTYQSWGRLLIIGEEDAAAAAAARLKDSLDCTLFAPSDAEPEPAARDGLSLIRGGRAHLDGRLGAFVAKTAGEQGDPVLLQSLLPALPEAFDLVLDLSANPQMTQEIPPPGYYAPGDDRALEKAIEELPDMRGEFEKPKFFDYDPEICAHGRSGLKGCTRCIDACPTVAITSLGDTVEVSPYLCQGAGSCVAACPTGAMTYAFPGVDDLLELIRGMLGAYRDAGGQEAPCLVFHDAWSRGALMADLAEGADERVVPVQVEEVGSVGLEVWLSGLAYGAGSVQLLVTRGTPGRVLRELEEQVGFGRAILSALGMPDEAIGLMTAGEPVDWQALPSAVAGRPAKFQAPDDKRGILRLAIDHLHRQAESPKKVASLPAGAPFGEIKVDRDACTLCMSCVSVCPAAAVQAGGDLPQLKFVEWNCVQCGLCEKACPEDAITLHQRLLFDPEARQSSRILHEEQPFCCVVCGKPFATQSVLDRMMAKLEGHWMFQTEEQKRRLQMCDTCRVKDMFQDQRGGGAGVRS